MYQNAPGYNGYLTEFAQAAFADENQSIAGILFPPVEVKTNVGHYKKRDINNAFRVYDTRLSRSNTPTRIDVNAVKAYYDCQPNALEVCTSKHDMDQDEGEEYREENLQDLMSSTLISREVQAVNIWKKGVAATSGSGIWTGEAGKAANILLELDEMAARINRAVGQRPTHMIIGFAAWCIMRNHPSLLNRVSGIATDVTEERLKSMLVYKDMDIRIATLPCQPEKRGKKADLAEIMGKDIFMFYSSDSPTRSDMSAAKDFTRSAAGPEVITDERSLETVDMLYWSTDRQVTCPAAAGRIAVV